MANGMAAGYGTEATQGTGYKPTNTKVLNQAGQWVDDPYATGTNSASAAAASLDVAKQQGDVDYSINPTGQTNYSNQSAQARQTEQMRLSALKDARDSFMSVTGGSGGAVSPTVAPPNVQGDEQDARRQVFARAKDQAAQIARASVNAITENMAGRGVAGSGMEALKSAGAIQDSSNPLLALNAQQAATDVNRAADISDMSYTGAIQQRGQDMSQRSSYLNLLRSLY